jgi:hypothetical protein
VQKEEKKCKKYVSSCERYLLFPLVAQAASHDFWNVVNQVALMGLAAAGERAHAAYLANSFLTIQAKVYARFGWMNGAGR